MGKVYNQPHHLRLRRLRSSEPLRKLVQETNLFIHDLIYPLFITNDNGIKTPIASMPGIYQFSLNALVEELKELVALSIPGVILFGIPATKDTTATLSYSDLGIVQQATRLIKQMAPQLLVITDVCCCQYTTHGHCGIINYHKQHPETAVLDNDATLPILAKQAVSFAKAGADIVAPSSMIDSQVATIRNALDAHGYTQIPILSYSVKYASSMYGPFREAAKGTPKFGDRNTYQMNPANSNEAIREVQLDIQEGADIIMVKPAHTYLDIIYKIKQQFPEIPLAAYHVSGEYSIIKAAAQHGWIDEKAAMLEILTSIKRAGADLIITYFAKDFAKTIQNVQARGTPF